MDTLVRMSILSDAAVINNLKVSAPRTTKSYFSGAPGGHLERVSIFHNPACLPCQQEVSSLIAAARAEWGYIPHQQISGPATGPFSHSPLAGIRHMAFPTCSVGVRKV